MTARLARRWLPVTAIGRPHHHRDRDLDVGCGRVRPGDWALPDDLWRTLIAAQRLLHGDLSGLYTPPTEPGQLPRRGRHPRPGRRPSSTRPAFRCSCRPQNPDPGAWLLAGPYEIAIASLALFAADAIAEHLGAAWPKRAVLAAAGAVALWGVTVRFGHPEDAVAVGLFLYGILALARSRAGRSAWLIGAAVAVQPLVLLALPVLLAVVPSRGGCPAFLARAAAPGAAAAGYRGRGELARHRHRGHQPAQLTDGQPPHAVDLAGRAPGRRQVAAGPARALAILVACGCAVAAGRAATACSGRWSPDALAGLLWWVAVALAAPLGVRAGDGGLLPVARARGGADPGVTELAAAGRDVRRRHRRHVRGAGTVAGPVELVGADDRGPGPRPLARPRGLHPCRVMTRAFWPGYR